MLRKKYKQRFLFHTHTIVFLSVAIPSGVVVGASESLYDESGQLKLPSSYNNTFLVKWVCFLNKVRSCLVFPGLRRGRLPDVLRPLPVLLAHQPEAAAGRAGEPRREDAVQRGSHEQGLHHGV